MNKSKRHQRAPKPAPADAPKPQQTVEPPKQAIAIMPEKLVREQRGHSTQIIEALAKTAVALSARDGDGTQVDIMQRLWNMQKEAEDRQAEREFNIAKVSVAMELPAIPKTKKREFTDKNGTVQTSMYADLDDIEGVLDPICRRHGIVKEYSTKTDARGWAAQICTIRHVSGHKEVYEGPYMPLDTSGSKNNNQAAGSTAKYGRRYTLIGAFNIYHIDDDLDGALPKTDPAGDKFTSRVQAQAQQAAAATPEAPATLTLPQAAKALEDQIRNCPVNARGALLMKHIKIIGEMEKDTAFSAKAADLRKLCEEQPHAA